MSSDITVVSGVRALVLMHPDCTVFTYLIPGKPEMAMRAVEAMSIGSLKGHMLLTVSRAYELGLDLGSGPVSPEDLATVQSTWRSLVFKEWLDGVNAKSWLERSEVEDVLKEVLVVRPIMDG